MGECHAPAALPSRLGQSCPANSSGGTNRVSPSHKQMPEKTEGPCSVKTSQLCVSVLPAPGTEVQGWPGGLAGIEGTEGTGGKPKEVPELWIQDKQHPLAELLSSRHSQSGREQHGLFPRPSMQGCFLDDIVFVAGTSFVPGTCLYFISGWVSINSLYCHTTTGLWMDRSGADLRTLA